jgi:hypothetical protein
MLRHLIGFGLAIGLAAAICFGGGWGVAKMTVLAAQGTSLTSVTGLSALGALLLTGLFLGILLVAPVSPLSTTLPGLALLGWTALFAVHPQLANRLMPLHTSQVAAGLHLLLTYGVLALLGITLICPAFVPTRWRPASATDLGLDRGSGGDDEAPGLPTPTRLLS